MGDSETIGLIELLRFEQLSVAFAVVYLAFAIRQSLWCWPAALVSVALWAAVAVDAKLYMDALLQLFYFAMGIYGWQQWARGGEQGAGVSVHRWVWSWHLATIAAIAVVSLVLGRAWSGTDAEFPYLDSFTTVAAVVATFMLTRKLIENWIYWFVIDALYIYLYLERGLEWYAGLYAVYLVMIVFGFRAWLVSLRREAVSDERRAG